MATQPYNGTRRKLVIAFDVGTTYSGVSFAKLEPGTIPIIQGVTRFPAQQNVGGSSKIPSVLYYDDCGNVRAIGTEAMDDAFQEEAEDNGYTKVEWFKLHLRPKTLSGAQISDHDIPALPREKRPVDILVDFLKYLFACTRGFIVEGMFNGEQYWASLKGNIDFVLTHPNGWEGYQQNLMRQAAVIAGLVREGDADGRIQFVTEGEASLHFCIMNGALSSMHSEKGMIIVDAGGGTIDLSAYRKVNSGAYQEIAATQCRLQGSIFVSRRAHAHLQEHLSGTRFASEESLAQIVEEFDQRTKLTFRDETPWCFIKFGGVADRDNTVGIRNGQLKLPGNVVADLFRPSLDSIVEAVRIQRREASVKVATIFLVGGFAASDWLFANLKREMAAHRIAVYRPDGHVNKAVADGAISYYLDHQVTSRVSRFSYGAGMSKAFEPQYAKRASTVYMNLEGIQMVPNCYDEILGKGTSVEEVTEFYSTYSMQSRIQDDLSSVSMTLFCYKRDGKLPTWTDDDRRPVHELCTILADCPVAAREQILRRSRTGVNYYQMTFDVVLLFGLTELKAQIRWYEKGVEKRCPTVVVYTGDEPEE